MAIEFNCSKCGQRNVVAGTLAGNSVRCRECGAVVRVPVSDATSSTPTDIPPQPGYRPQAMTGGADYAEDPDYVHTSLPSAAETVPHPVPRKSSGPTVLIVILVICAGIGIWFASRGDRSNTGPASVPTARLNAIKLAQAAPEPAYQRLPNCWASELTIRDPDSARQVTLWVYLPPVQKKGTPRSLACVFVAAGGPGQPPGAHLAEVDHEEHLALLKADFAVVAYDVEGAVPKPDAVGPAAVGPLVQFMAAEAGVADAQVAIEYALRHMPEVDPSRLYAAGAGSSGTVALLLAANDPRIHGCAVRAPIVDLATPLALYHNRLNEMVQDATAFLVDHSPYKRIASATSPIWVFHAEDDPDVPLAESYRLTQASGKVLLDHQIATGDAARSRQIGRGRAIKWLEDLDDKISGGLRRTSHIATSPQVKPTHQENLPDPIAKPVQPSDPTKPNPPTPTPQPDTSPSARPDTGSPAPPATQNTIARPDTPTIPTDTTAQRIAAATERLAGLGVKVRADSTGQVQTLDLAGMTDPTKAAEYISSLGKVGIVHLTAAQTTPAIVAALKALPAIGGLRIDADNLTHVHIEQIASLANVEELSLLQVNVGPGGLQALAGMTKLGKLNLREAKIDDDACESLGKLASLKTLDLSDTPITGKGIAQLKGLKNLVMLRLKNTQVRQDAIDDLHDSLPRVNIIPP